MLLAKWLNVSDAMAFLDAFAEAAEKTRGWKLEGNKIDCGVHTVVARYIGRKFEGEGLMVVAFAHLGTTTRVNLTLRAREWPEHICFDEVAKGLIAPLLRKAHKSALSGLRLAK